MLIPVVRKKVEYYTEWYDVVEFLRQQKFELVNNRECLSIDIRLPTLIDSYTHYVGHVSWEDLNRDTDFEWIRSLIKDNRQIEFIQKYQDKIVWKESYMDCVINTEELEEIKEK